MMGPSDVVHVEKRRGLEEERKSFLSSGVTRACLNAVGKMPVRRDVLIMCVSAGKSVGEISQN